MDLQFLESSLTGIFGKNSVKPYSRGFRIIIGYDNMPYCVVLRVDRNGLVLERDAVDEDEDNYEEAFKKAYKLLIQNKSKLGIEIVV